MGRDILISAGLGLGIVYLAAHTVGGPTGLASYLQLQAKERQLEQDLSELTAQRAALQERVARLDPQDLDTDFLDERARALTGLADPRELLLTPPDSPPPGR